MRGRQHTWRGDVRVGETSKITERHGPTVICPGCKIPMRLILLEPAGPRLETATFKCEQCALETKREMVWRDRGQDKKTTYP